MSRVCDFRKWMEDGGNSLRHKDSKDGRDLRCPEEGI
jgi:hypothetical protein